MKNSKKYIIWSILILVAVIVTARIIRKEFVNFSSNNSRVYAPVYVLEMSAKNGYLEEKYAGGDSVTVKKNVQVYKLISLSPFTLESRVREGLTGFWTDNFKSTIIIDNKTMTGIAKIYDINAPVRQQELIVKLQLNNQGGFNASFKNSEGQVHYGVFRPIQ